MLRNEFNRVLIKDSVCFQVHESLANDYPGSGGAGSKAAIRIQFEYNLLSGTITDICLHAFNEQDATNSLLTIEKIEQKDLIIRDLAYMSLDVLKQIIKKAATYLCRPNTNVTIYELINGTYIEIDYNKIVNYMKKNKIPYIEKIVYYGSRDKLKTRLIMHLLPAEELAKRLRKAKQNNIKEGGDGNLSKKRKAQIALNLFITNATTEQIPTEHVWAIYRLRWQIELMFKIWKSICDIEKVKKVNKERLECYVYSKLIFIVLGWKTIWLVAKNMFWIAGKALSFFKAFKALFKRKIVKFKNAVTSSKYDMIKFILDFYEHALTNYLLEKRQQKPTSLEIMLTCFNNNINTVSI